MAKNNKLIKPEVERLYLEGKDAGDIMKIFPQLPSSTLYTWIQKYKWNEKRDSKLTKYTKTPEILLDTLERMIQSLDTSLTDPLATAKTADAISKIVKSIKSLSKEKDRLSSILFTIGELGKYMNTCEISHLFDEEFRNKFDKLLTGFGELMLEKYSPKNLD